MDRIKRKTYALFFYGSFLMFMVMRYFDELFLSQVISNPIRSPRIDLVVWTTHYLGIPDLVANPTVSLIIDFLIVVLPIVILYRLYFDKKVNKLVAIHSLLFGLYVLIIYCFPTLSIRKYLGLILIPIAFIFTSNKRYLNYLELMRYYVLFIFTSASLWKVFRGSVIDPNHLHQTLRGQHIDNFVNWPDHYITQLISTIIDDPNLCAIIFFLAVISQLAFVIGFFTKKYDVILAVLLIIFVVSDFLVMRIEYWEFIVFLPLFLYKYIKEPELNPSSN